MSRTNIAFENYNGFISDNNPNVGYVTHIFTRMVWKVVFTEDDTTYTLSSDTSIEALRRHDLYLPYLTLPPFNKKV